MYNKVIFLFVYGFSAALTAVANGQNTNGTSPAPLIESQTEAECGVLPSTGIMPWHVTVYYNSNGLFRMICGGSLITNSVVLSVAHCFWDTQTSELKPASAFSVALGEVMQLSQDQGVQRSNVKAVYIEPYFQGTATNYQADIAVVTLDKAIQYKPHIRPVCLNFDATFESRQLSEGNAGKLANVLKTNRDLTRAEPFKTSLDLSYISISECLKKNPDFKQFITFDKICAGSKPGAAELCIGTSGNGLVFPETIDGSTRYYLRGILSTAPVLSHGDTCNSYGAFTQVSKHESFIRQHLDQVDIHTALNL